MTGSLLHAARATRPDIAQGWNDVKINDEHTQLPYLTAVKQI